MSIELKTCPFCGEKPIFTKDFHRSNGVWYYEISCNKCKLHLGPVVGEKSLITKWNTRYEERRAE